MRLREVGEGKRRDIGLLKRRKEIGGQLREENQRREDEGKGNRGMKKRGRREVEMGT